MKLALGVGFVLVLVLALFPSDAAACKTCDVPSFWNPNCGASGCTYCVACSICCNNDPGAGGNCALYCGGGALFASTPTPTKAVFLAAPEPAPQLPDFLAAPAAGGCSLASR